MDTPHYPSLSDVDLADTRSALHAYARILGNWLKHCRNLRKHWWHASLRPSLNGLTTGVVHAAIDFEIELNLRESLLQAQASTGRHLSEKLQGQPASAITEAIAQFLITSGIDAQSVPEMQTSHENSIHYTDYSSAHAQAIAQILNSVAATMEIFRAGIREETSPIQLWPHHFDLSLLWLPGEKVCGQDPLDEESADQQMNFGFTFGDENIAEPYFYITAYPLPEGLPNTALPSAASWQSGSFSGAVISYKSLLESSANPNSYLLELWRGLLKAGREHLLIESDKGAIS